jgi:hypothetical protein
VVRNMEEFHVRLHLVYLLFIKRACRSYEITRPKGIQGLLQCSGLYYLHNPIYIEGELGVSISICVVGSRIKRKVGIRRHKIQKKQS